MKCTGSRIRVPLGYQEGIALISQIHNLGKCAEATLLRKLLLDPLHFREIHTFARLCLNRSLCLLVEFKCYIDFKIIVSSKVKSQKSLF